MRGATRVRWGVALSMGLSACTPDSVAEGLAGAADEPVSTPAAAPRRVLLVIVDDLSAAATPMYAADYTDVEFSTAPMPTVQGICDRGVRFQHAWSAPSCAPSRANMLTGRYSFRNDSIDLTGNDADLLSPDEPTLPRLLASSVPEVALASFGKYNLGHTSDNGDDAAPNVMGWPHYAGFLDAAPPDYSSWLRTVNGATEVSSNYITTQTVDDTIEWLGTKSQEEPWMVWLAFTAPHAPFHAPPTALHDYDELGAVPTYEPGTDPAEMAEDLRPFYQAATQAMDTELGRLLAWLEANGQGDADVIFIADNGSPPEVIEAPMEKERSKGTVYQGGVHVPLCVAGPSVVDGGRVVAQPVGAVDILATVLDLAGAPVADVLQDGTYDSQSLAPVLRDPAASLARTWAYTEGSGDLSADGDSRAVIQDGSKLIRFIDAGSDVLFSLVSDPFEEKDELSDDDDDGHDNDDDGDDQGHEGQNGQHEPSAEALARSEKLGLLIDALHGAAE